LNIVTRTILITALVGLALSASGCGAQAKNGDTVQVQYKGTLADGSVFDPGAQPLTFTVGKGDVIPGFDAAVAGMRVGDSKTVTIPAAEAYGPVRPELVVTLNRSELPNVKDPEVGQTLRGTSPDGRVSTATITAVTDKTITIDQNHPLAGKDLTFYIKVLEIQAAK
jgi:peptidylprolyl isomerase